MDHPSHRGSHDRPTPTLGGLAIVMVFFLTTWVVVGSLSPVAEVLPALSVGALLVAVIGWVDDLRPLPIAPRLGVHFAAIALVLWACGGLHTISVGLLVFELPPWAQVLVLIAMVWFVNLFNFMDGVDGIAASEAVFVAGCAAIFCWSDGQRDLAVIWGALGGAAAGFLVWNWAPARLFMGDIGSGFLGFVVASLLVISINSGAISLATALALVSVFVVDATWTLVRRFFRGERWYSGHRTHAYQRLARRWGSHARVAAAVTALNVLVVAPTAWVIESQPSLAAASLSLLITLLVGLAVAAGAGRSEQIG
jgi:Fuc2NAc and GlcNAc transferase